MEKSKYGLFLRSLRESGGHGSIASLASRLGVDKNTLQGYESGRTLPEVDFLAVFADRTGADFNELLRLRLESGKTEEARLLSKEYERIQENKAKYEAAQKVTAEEDYIRGDFFDDKEAAKRYKKRMESVGARLRGARQSLEQIEADLDYRPDESWHQIVITLMFCHNLDEAGAAFLLDSLKKHLKED